MYCMISYYLLQKIFLYNRTHYFFPSMKSLYSSMVFLIFLFSPGSVFAGKEFCTLEYAPVCGMVNGKSETFSNTCFAWLSGATSLSDWECGSRIGWSRDRHGCLTSAWYAWDAGLSACARPWEKKSEIWQVFGTTFTCIGSGGLMEENCLRVIFPWNSSAVLHAPIIGFSPTVWYWYTLRVEVSRSESPYRLIRILRQIAPSQTLYYRWNPFWEK